MEYRPMFFRQMTEAFLVRTEPAYSMVKPAHIHITNAPQMRNENVLSTKPVSWATAALARAAKRPTTSAMAAMASEVTRRGPP